MSERFEKKYGPIPDRVPFTHKDIEVPLQLRGFFNDAPRSLPRGLFLNDNQMLRSRTYFTLSSDPRAKFHGSTPDLSRSVPTTPIFRKFGKLKERSDSLALESTTPRLREERFTDEIVELRQAHGVLTPRFASVAAIAATSATTPSPTPSTTVAGAAKDGVSPSDAGQVKAINVQTPTLGASRQPNSERPVLSTFRSTMPPPSSHSSEPAKNTDSTVTYATPFADIVNNRFNRRENLKIDKPTTTMTDVTNKPELRQQAQNLLYSSSFAIKRPSLYGTGRSSLGSTQSLYDIYEGTTHFSVERAEPDFRLPAKKATALLDSIEPSLRASIKLGSVQEVNSLDVEEVKYTIPRIGITDKKSKRSAPTSPLDEDSLA